MCLFMFVMPLAVYTRAHRLRHLNLCSTRVGDRTYQPSHLRDRNMFSFGNSDRERQARRTRAATAALASAGAAGAAGAAGGAACAVVASGAAAAAASAPPGASAHALGPLAGMVDMVCLCLRDTSVDDLVHVRVLSLGG